MLIRTYIGVSIDGFMATPDAFPAWDAMPSFVPGESYGIGEFTEQCDAVVVGRTTFDFAHAYWAEQAVWPWEGKRVFVLTSRPLQEQVPADVTASQGGPAGLVDQLRAAPLARDVQLLGGQRTIQAFLKLGAIDRFGLCILPILLGDGVPLFAPGIIPQMPQRLDHQQVFSDGAVALSYTSVGDAASQP